MSLLIDDLGDGTRRLTLDRPKAANAMNRAMHEGLVAALDAAAKDGAIRAILLTGAGGRVFSAGADLREDLGPETRSLRRGLLMRSLLAVLDCPKPLLAVIRGKAVGGGAMLALLADEVLMEEGASLSMPELSFGLPSPIGAAIIAARGGRPMAHALVQAGEVIGAKAALAAGLADSVRPDAALDEWALDRGKRLGGPPPTAFAVNKVWMNATLRETLHRAEAHAAEAHRAD
jgi:enoyl-CoA hydratase/carnithine racemase